LWEFLKQRISSLVAQLDEPETACRELIRIVQFLSGAERVALILYTPGQPHPPFWSENVKSEQRRYIRSVEKIVRSTGKEYFNEDPLLDPNLRDKASVLAVRPSYVFGMPIRVPGGEPTLAGFLYLDDTKPYAILSEPVRREIRQLSAELAKQLLSEGAARARAPEGGDVPASVPRLIHGPNSPLKDIRERIKLFASYKRQVPVIILGESGTGKDIVANQLHYWRFHHYHPRSNAPFYAVNCGALEPSLITSSLFGHLKGSYTGATMSRKGMIDAADGGTLFIDEIGVMPPEGQAKLLRFLEDSKVCPIGGTVPHDVDAWLVSATNEDLVARAHERLFRSDLLSRLHLAVINLPPLRDRPAADFEALTIHFCRSEAAGIGIEPPRISSEAWEKLRSHNWPLNVRELKNCITRAFLLSRNQTIKAGHIEFLFTTRPPQNAVRGELTVMTADVVQPWETAMIEHEKALIINALDKCNGSVDKAAKLLGIASQTAHKKIKAYGLEDCKRSSGAASRRAFLSNYQRVISRLWRPNEE